MGAEADHRERALPLIAGDGVQILRVEEPRQSEPSTLSRSELWATLYLLGIGNALAAVIFPAIQSEVNLSIVTVAATVVGIHLLRQSPDAAVRRGDWIMAAVVAFLVLIPHRAASWVAVTGVALYSMGRDRRSTSDVAAASVFIAIAASSFWVVVLVQMLSSSLLAWDAALAAGLLEVVGHGSVERIGNVIVTGDETTLVVMVWCSSLQNVLYGFLCWTAIARAIRPEWQLADLLALLAVGGLVLTANTLRLALLGLSANTYEWVHGPVGSTVFNLGLLLLIAAIALHSTGPATSSLGHLRSAARGSEPHW